MVRNCDISKQCLRARRARSRGCYRNWTCTFLTLRKRACGSARPCMKKIDWRALRESWRPFCAHGLGSAPPHSASLRLATTLAPELPPFLISRYATHTETACGWVDVAAAHEHFQLCVYGATFTLHNFSLLKWSFGPDGIRKSGSLKQKPWSHSVHVHLAKHRSHVLPRVIDLLSRVWMSALTLLQRWNRVSTSNKFHAARKHTEHHLRNFLKVSETCWRFQVLKHALNTFGCDRHSSARITKCSCGTVTNCQI